MRDKVRSDRVHVGSAIVCGSLSFVSPTLRWDTVEIDDDRSKMDVRGLFWANPAVNPESGRRITSGGPKYQELVRKYGDPCTISPPIRNGDRAAPGAGTSPAPQNPTGRHHKVPTRSGVKKDLRLIICDMRGPIRCTPLFLAYNSETTVADLRAAIVNHVRDKDPGDGTPHGDKFFMYNGGALLTVNSGRLPATIYENVYLTPVGKDSKNVVEDYMRAAPDVVAQLQRTPK